MYCNVNDFVGLTDSDRIENAIKNSDGKIIYIPARKCDVEPERDYWLIDRAILLPENTTVVLYNAKIKLSDKCRDNFFRTANCGLGIKDIKPIKNVHIKGVGRCILEGADHPRATGDSTKFINCPAPKSLEDICKYAEWVPEERRSPEKLQFVDVHGHTYGTDEGKEGECQHGDWRNIGILFASAEHCSISGLKIVNSHGWGISFEDCAYSTIDNMEFEASMIRDIDGMLHNSENQDGIDLRNGCHDIMISNITGGTGDDLIALTAIANTSEEKVESGSHHYHVMHNDWSKRCRDIYNVIIRNVKGYSAGGLAMIRLLAVETRIYNVVVDDVIDTSPEYCNPFTVLWLGEGDIGYGKNLPDSINNVSISNIISKCRVPIYVGGYVKDAVFSNIVNRNPDTPVIVIERENGLQNAKLGAIATVGEKILSTD